MSQPKEEPVLDPPFLDLDIVDGPLQQLINEDLPWLRDETPPPYYNLTQEDFTSIAKKTVCMGTQTMTECTHASKSIQTNVLDSQASQALQTSKTIQIRSGRRQVSRGTQVQPTQELNARPMLRNLFVAGEVNNTVIPDNFSSSSNFQVIDPHVVKRPVKQRAFSILFPFPVTSFPGRVFWSQSQCLALSSAIIEPGHAEISPVQSALAPPP